MGPNRAGIAAFSRLLIGGFWFATFGMREDRRKPAPEPPAYGVPNIGPPEGEGLIVASGSIAGLVHTGFDGLATTGEAQSFIGIEPVSTSGENSEANLIESRAAPVGNGSKTSITV